MLGDRYKDYAVLIEELEELTEIEERPGESVNFVDDNAVDLAFLDMSKELLKRRSFDVGAGVASVII